MTAGCADNTQSAVLRLGIPYSDKVQDYDSNYYLEWLEERTGIEIEPVVIRQTRPEEYLDQLFNLDINVDAVLFGNNFEISEESLLTYIEDGKLLQLENGEYCYYNYGTSAREDCSQVMWVNAEWLQKLGLSVPKTTEEFREVLRKFKSTDLNGNGLMDEIPLIGSISSYSLNPCEFILNSFCINDPYNSRFYVINGEECYAPLSDKFAEGISFCNELYEEGLLDERTFSYTQKDLSELVNSPDSYVGAFTTDRLSDVLYQGNPEIMARYIHIYPLKGPSGEQNAVALKRERKVGAIIPSSSKNAELAKTFLSYMLTKDASLIARYGEEGVDWYYSDGSEVSIFGTKSTIVTQNYIWNVPQNKHLNGIGPIDVPEEYILGVTWNGVNSDAEYIDARAKINYADFYPESFSSHGYDKELLEKCDLYLIQMIKGETEIDEKVFSDLYYNN